MRNSRRVAIPVILAALMVSVTAQAQWTWTPQTGRWVNMKRLPKETAELQVEHARSLMIAGKYKEALRETGKFIEFYGNTALADENQFLRAEIRMAQGELFKAAEGFQRVLSSYPETSLYNDAVAKQYEIGDAFYSIGQEKVKKSWRLFKRRPLRRAVDVYTMVIDNQPFTAAAAEAQYKVGLCEYTCKNYTDAALEYRRVIEDYAGSEWVDEAGHGLAVCYFEQSLPPEYDQEPSELAIEAIDSFHARYPSDSRNAELQGYREEMRTRIAEQRLQTAKFYEKRRRFSAARIYYEVVVKQFAETAAADEAKAWLDSNPMREDDMRKRLAGSGAS